MRGLLLGGVVAIALIVMCSAKAQIKVSSVLRGWVDKEADIAIAIDSSTSIFINDFHIMTDFVADMVNGMDIGPSKTRIAVGIYSSKYKEYVPLANNLSKSNLVDRVKDIGYLFGDGILARGLDGIQQSLNSSVTRKGVPRIGLIFTDGDRRYRQLALDSSIRLKKEGIHLMIIGIGREANEHMLRNLASDPKETTMYWVQDFTSLSEIAFKRKLMTNIAEVEYKQADESSCGKTRKADIFFAFDEFKLGKIKSEIVKRFIKGVVEELNMDSGNIRAGVLSQICSQKDIELNQYLSREEFISGLGINKERQGLSALVEMARQRLLDPTRGARTFTQNYIIIFVSKETKSELRPLMSAARTAKYSGIQTFVVDVDSSFVRSHLVRMASKADFVANFGSFDGMLDEMDNFMQNFCQGLG